jgi:hypothetical protein|tara:strand:+ start:1771 stop:2001 length:231 start_codon:yes stop_codon:yes gene_type:complete
MQLICLENNRRNSGVPKRMLLLMLLLTSGCVSAKLENSKRLMMHPEFEHAATNAPEFTREALKTINRLEYEIERRK